MADIKQPKVSILVPCYNVEKFLPQCLDSVVNQTLKDIEIICINDGSTDNTLKIIKDYAKHDKRIIIIDKGNGGYGSAMNCGLNVATGEYIGIVESDDWVELDAFEILYNTAKKNNADLVKADFVFFDNDTNKETAGWDIGVSSELKQKVFCPTKTNSDIIWSGHPSIWTCLYSNKMLKEYKIKFAETPGASFQDMGFKPKTFIAAKRFYYLPKVVLHYRKHANNSDKNNNKVFAICDVHDDTDKWLRQNIKDYKKYIKIANQCRLSNYIWNQHRLYGKSKREFCKHFRQEFKEFYKSGNLNPEYVDNKTWLKLLSTIYPWNPIYPITRLFISVISPIYKTRIHNGYRCKYFCNAFAFSKTPITEVTK